ncbi:CVNH domain-containing protein [Phanerochaete sordida]|uniref:CVNH domain-containing protein n=1 Tax=Phanerochaete sordida TaxID=48140 RepID=A0A9P3GUB9_9APHY|nr:CVNH domain-containing protein [Phanerochaete sordida]
MRPHQKTIPSIVALLIATVCVTADFQDSCYRIVLDDSEVTASCRDTHGNYQDTSIDITTCLGVTADHKLVCDASNDGSARGCVRSVNCELLESRKTLYCRCGYGEMTINLGTCVQNINGQLMC